MTHDELLEKIETTLGSYIGRYYGRKKDRELRVDVIDSLQALRAVVELHKPVKNWYDGIDEITDCKECQELISDEVSYPCPTIQAIEKELI